MEIPETAGRVLPGSRFGGGRDATSPKNWRVAPPCRPLTRRKEHNIQRIHIFGASGSGTSTLGQALAQRLGVPCFDTDDFYWKVKYTQAEPVGARLLRLREALVGPKWILAGQLAGWGDPLIPLFDLAVFLFVPTDVRLERLREREFRRYGNAVLPGGERAQATKEFLDWAALYDTAGPELRSLRRHRDWKVTLPCPVLELGDRSVDERVQAVVEKMAR